MKQGRTQIITRLVCAAIRWYKAVLSPRKRFGCAHRILHQGDSCSTAVLKIVEQNGVFAGMPHVFRQFNACRRAANILAETQRSELDCGLSGCLDVGGAEGCLGGLFGGGEAASGAGSSNCFFIGNPFFLFTGKRGGRNLGILVILAMMGLLSGYFAYGNKITGIELRLLDPALEDRDRKWKLVANSELPDYQVLLTIDEEEIKSSTVHNRSAVDWVYLEFPVAFTPGDVRKIEITNRQLLSSKALESFPEASIQGEGKVFEYRLIRRWNIF